MGEQYPSNYLELEKMVISERKRRMPPIMSLEEFKALASVCLIGESSLLTAMSLLHNLGSLVHIPNDPKVASLLLVSLVSLED